MMKEQVLAWVGVGIILFTLAWAAYDKFYQPQPVPQKSV